ncbi:MAG: PAS domain S-box protein [Deltaproteobacteria bacterium]|nr:MAG: PAS domain S-box protein [Deltaproteobacteria bacterium]
MREKNLTAEEERRKKRVERILIAVTAILVVALAILQATVASSVSRIPLVGNVLVFIFINLNVLLILVLFFLVFRNAFRLFLERKRKVPGAGIRFRLVATFVLFSAIPMVIFFYVSYKLTTSSINFWIGRQMGEGFESAIKIAQTYYEDKKSHLTNELNRLVLEIKANGKGESPNSALEWTALYSPGKGLTTLFGSSPPDLTYVLDVIGEGKTEEIVHRSSRYIVGARKVEGGTYLLGSVTIPREIERGLDAVGEAYKKYSQVRILNDPIKASNLAILLMVALLIIFTNTWIGFYLARDLTTPLKELAQGVEALSKKGEPFHVDYEREDEIGLLVKAFNRMSEEIVSSRKELEIAHRKLTSQFNELSQKNSLIEAILASITTGVVTIDKSGHVERINEAARMMLGLESVHVEGQHYRSLFPPRLYEKVREKIASLDRKKKVFTASQVIEGEGGRKHLVLRGCPIFTGKQYYGIVVTLEDVTEQVEEERLKTVAEMAQKVAHEMKNPLTPIRLMTQRLRKKYGERVGEKEFDEMVDVILTSVDRISLLVEEFKKTTRLPETRLVKEDFTSFLKNLVESYGLLHPDVTFRFIAEERLPEIFFDPAKMRSAFINLLDNAVWAVRQKGGGGEVTVTLTAEEGLVRVKVRDTGVGIPDGFHEKIFDVKFTRREGGLGLGLSIVRSAILDHEGRVYASREVKEGALFVVEFPLKEEV